MNVFRQIHGPSWRIAALGLLLAGLLWGCGGGSGTSTAGVGTGGSGLAEGSVSGFGSVIVDGVEYDDASAAVTRDDGTGTAVNAELKLGQRVRIAHDASLRANTVVVMAQLVGPVGTAPDSSGELRVMGQRVRLSGSAADLTGGTPAVLDGFAAGSIAAGDEVEVHGVWVYDSTLASYVLTASRVEKLAAAADPVQLSGIVQAVAGTSLRLNAATGLTLQAASQPPSVSAGHMVRAWVNRTALATLASGTLTARRVEDLTLTAADVADQSLRLAGPSGRYNPVTRSLEVQGVTVQLPPGLAIDEAALQRGDFVNLQVRRSGDSLVASAAGLRGGPGSASDLGQSVSLKAIVSGVDWSASPVHLTLRGVAVVAPASVVPLACRVAASSTDLEVVITARLTGGGATALASEVRCNAVSGSSGNVTVERTGTVSQLNLAQRSFTLLTAQGSVNVQWDGQTFFPNEFLQHPESLTGQSVEVEGVNQTGVLRARKVKRDN